MNSVQDVSRRSKSAFSGPVGHASRRWCDREGISGAPCDESPVSTGVQNSRVGVVRGLARSRGAAVLRGAGGDSRSVRDRPDGGLLNSKSSLRVIWRIHLDRRSPLFSASRPAARRGGERLDEPNASFSLGCNPKTRRSSFSNDGWPDGVWMNRSCGLDV